MRRTKKAWFKTKRYGWGWMPATWQGWLVLAAYIAYNANGLVGVDVRSHAEDGTLGAWVPYFFASTAVMILICYATGERPRWRWGGK